ncbi:MAG: hypothetical protein A3J29_08840 [Acidobacteria bacterium RIFCSPLOWO2_12_FULL_67_14b]|nr:MAG: hypothetical protein A3J29_08840 [Acidobacteria bacterium RIFCSPLOWO2_12_FULL_67_14b]
MRSPTIALLWEIWRRHWSTVAVIGGLTVVGRLVDVLESRRNAGAESSPLTTLLAMVAFLLLVAVFNYTESGGVRGVGQFPRRLFTLPVTSLHLVAVPMLAGITSIELLYLLWMEPLSRDGSARAPLVAILLAAFVVFYLCALWTLERAGSLRLVMLGVIAIAVFAIGILPSFPPNPPPWWRLEIVLAGLVAGLAVIAFLLAWRHVARLRDGGGRSAHRAGSLFNWIAEATPTRRTAFANPAAAHFWFEWRTSGLVLPALVGGVLLVVVIPMSWLMRSNAGDTFRLLLAALAAPVVLAVPVGIAFSKPTFWSEDLAVPAFVAALPLSSEDLVAIKVRVAAMSAVLSWLVVLVHLTVWLSSWGNLDALSLLALQLWAFHGQSVAAVYGIAVLVAFAGMFLTWRFLVSRLWSGLSGRRPLFVASVVAIVVLVIAGLVFDADRLPRWLLDDPARLAPVVWIAAIAVIAKYWIAAYAWRVVTPRYLRVYLLIWLAGTASFLAFGIVVWGVVRIYLPVDVDRLRSLVILVALLAVPLARVGLAPASLTHNRHRS